MLKFPTYHSWEDVIADHLADFTRSFEHYHGSVEGVKRKILTPKGIVILYPYRNTAERDFVQIPWEQHDRVTSIFNLFLLDSLEEFPYGKIPFQQAMRIKDRRRKEYLQKQLYTYEPRDVSLPNWTEVKMPGWGFKISPRREEFSTVKGTIHYIPIAGRLTHFRSL